MGKIEPYGDWLKKEGVPMIDGVYVPDMRVSELSDWPRKGVKGAIAYLDGDDVINGRA